MTPRFHGPLDLRAYRSDKWKVLTPFAYTTLVFGKPHEITVPQKFITDLASIPQIVRSLIPVNGRHRQAAVIHDFLYHTADLHDFTRLQCDLIFREAMQVAKVNWFKREVMYRAVRVGAWMFFKRRRNAK